VWHRIENYTLEPYNIYTPSAGVFSLFWSSSILWVVAANIIVQENFGIGRPSLFQPGAMRGEILVIEQDGVGHSRARPDILLKTCTCGSNPEKGVYSLGFVTNKDETEYTWIYKGNTE
jgi:hypothetical protein